MYVFSIYFKSTKALKPSLACQTPLLRIPAVMAHLMRGSVLLTAASGWLLVVLAHVHHLSLGALSDQVPANAGDIFKTMTWWTKDRGESQST